MFLMLLGLQCILTQVPSLRGQLACGTHKRITGTSSSNAHVRRVGGSIKSESLRLSGCLVVFHSCSPVFLLAKATPGDTAHSYVFLPHRLVSLRTDGQGRLASPHSSSLDSSITMLLTHHFIRADQPCSTAFADLRDRPQTLSKTIPLS